MISTDTKAGTTAMNFDSDWRYIRLSNATSYDNEFILSSFNDHDWTSIQLPHHDDKKLQKITSTCVSYWYRKRFNFQQKLDLCQQIYLHFESISKDNQQNNDELDVKIPGITIWLNENEIFSKTLSEPVNLTKYLKNDSKNLIVIHSKQGYRLHLHARLLLPRRFSGQIDLDELRLHSEKNGRGKIIDYQAGFDDSDGLIAVFINAVQKHAKRNQLNNKYDTNLDIDDDDDEKEQLRKMNNAQTVETKTVIDGPIPRLAILMLIVGTRGDVQPFIALSKALLACGHRVRLAAHETFRKFVRENGIEFYPLAGDPADLMSFMVKNAGIVPSVSSIVAGDIAKSRRVMGEILASTWKACIEDDDETDIPFVAEAIIANPPSFGHIHCAQKLQIPLHIIFTMPWSPTIQFPHPLCKVDYNRASIERINMLSYDLVEVLTWSGMRNIINEFRKDTLGLPILHTRQAIRIMMDEHVPHTYCWSPSFVPKPADWGSHIDVSGFFFLDLASNYQPPDDIIQFLKSGDPPIYIGFGSITGHDSKRLLQVVLEALNTTGYRALLSGFEVDNDKLSDKILKIGNCPHDWLFQHVAAVCHHGGAGTTAAGLRAGKPTIIVPFFGDQFFWGSMISKSGAGPTSMPGKTITAKQLAAAFEFVHDPKTQSAALKISTNFQNEHGCQVAVQSFHAHLPLSKMRSDLEPSFGACFRLNEYDLQISRPVAQVLVAAAAIEEHELSPHTLHAWHTLIPGDGFKALTRGLKRAVSKITNSVNSLKRSRSVSNINRNAKNNTRHGSVDIGRPFKGILCFYGEVQEKPDEEHNENSTIEKKAGHTVHYSSDTHTEKSRNNNNNNHRNSTAATGSSPADSSPHRNYAKSQPDYTTIYGGSNKNGQQKSKTINQRSNLSKNKSFQLKDKNNNKTPEQRAADISGLSLDVCKQILSDFKEIKHKRYVFNENDKSIHRIRIPLGLHRSRSRSTIVQ